MLGQHPETVKRLAGLKQPISSSFNNAQEFPSRNKEERDSISRVHLSIRVSIPCLDCVPHLRRRGDGDGLNWVCPGGGGNGGVQCACRAVDGERREVRSASGIDQQDVGVGAVFS